MEFNIFTTLSKDNKELTHSAFLKFLLLEDQDFAKKFFNIEGAIKEEEIKLEKRLNKRLRADILINTPSLNLIIENKFKCLPQANQLKAYSEKIKEEKKAIPYQKFLLYFKKGTDFQLPEDWEFITYEDINAGIKELLERHLELPLDKKIFLQHYYEFLQDYIDAYKLLKKEPECLYDVFRNEFSYKGKFKKENAYWLNLMFHELASKFPPEYKAFVGGGSTYKPFINIHVPHWVFQEEGEGYEFVVQLNGNDLKFYANLNKVKNRQGIIEREVVALKSNSFINAKSGNYKGKLSAKSETGFIYREKLIDELGPDQFTLEGVADYIVKFIDRIDAARKLSSK